MPPDILLVRFSSIGDLVLTTPLLRAIKARHPAARLTMVVREDLADVLRHNPRLDRLITWRRGAPLGPLAAELRRGTWTHRIDLQGSLRSRRLRLMVGGQWSGYPKHRFRRALLIATHRRFGGSLGAVAERYFAAAAALDVTPDGGPAEFFTTAEAGRAVDAFLAERGLGRHRRLVALMPGAAQATKRWPEAHWRDLVDRLAPTSDVAVVGGPAERMIGERLVQAGGSAIGNAAGRFSLLESAALLRRADLLVSGDTGMLHIATAVGTPVIGLYGPGVPEFGFFPYQAPARVLERALSCRPCSAHGSERCPLGHHHCMQEITPEMVLAELAHPPR